MYADDEKLHFILLYFLRKKKVGIKDHRASCECSLSRFLINCHIHKIRYLLPFYAAWASYFLIFYNYKKMDARLEPLEMTLKQLVVVNLQLSIFTQSKKVKLSL
jgi:hypothetical protein